jgi:glyoxylase-like metal-dependent hydrolase (beta-lactamase superfamily II)
VPPEQLERELRSGAPVAVIDIRDRDAFAGWHLDPGAHGVLENVPEAELAGDPAAVLDRLPAGAPVRLICNAGNASRRPAAALAGLRPDIASVSGGMIGWARLLTADAVPMPGPARVIQLRREARGCLSYLIESDGEAMVVDPAPAIDAYLDEAGRLGATIVGVLDTHVHADHLSGARALAERTGAALYAPPASLARGVADPERFTPVADGRALPLGRADLRVVALPGHTSDMTGLVVDGAALVGGDSLFADSVARPDLESGDAGAGDAARELFATLHERVLSLPPETLLLPCHYPGGRRDAAIAPTLGDVRARLPELDGDPEAFVRGVLDGMPPRPANFEAIIEANLGRGPDADAAGRLEVGANNCAASRSWASA